VGSPGSVDSPGTHAPNGKEVPGEWPDAARLWLELLGGDPEEELKHTRGRIRVKPERVGDGRKTGERGRELKAQTGSEKPDTSLRRF